MIIKSLRVINREFNSFTKKNYQLFIDLLGNATRYIPDTKVKIFKHGLKILIHIASNS